MKKPEEIILDDSKIDSKIDVDDSRHTIRASRPTTNDPTRYGDWENKGRCIDF